MSESSDNLGQARQPSAIPQSQLVEYMGRYRQLDRWIRRYQRDPTDQDVAAVILTAIRKIEDAETLSGNPFCSNYPPPGQLPTGQGMVHLLDLPTSGALELPWLRAIDGICVNGPPDSGKTTFAWHVIIQLACLGFAVLLFDLKAEARRLLGLLGHISRCVVLTLEDLQFSLYQPIPGTSNDVISSNTTDLIGRTTNKMTAHLAYTDIVSAKRENGEIKPHEGVAIDQLIQGVEQFRTVGRRALENNESRKQGLQALRGRLGRVLSYTKTDFLNKLVEQPGIYIIELDGLPANIYIFIISHIISTLFASRKVPGSQPLVPVGLVLDDATFAVDRQLDYQSSTGSSPLTDNLLLSRARGIGLMIMSHAASSLSDKIRQNLHTHVFTNAFGEKRGFIQDLLGLTSPQYEHLRTQPRGQAVAMAPSVWPKPLLGRFPHVPLPQVSDAVCHESARQFLETVTCTKWSDPDRTTVSTQSESTDPASSTTADQPVPSISPDARRILVELICPVPPPITKLRERTGLSGERNTRAVRELENAGLANSIAIRTGRRGGAFRLVGLTPAGKVLIQDMGLVVPEQRVTGSWLHNACAVAQGEICRRKQSDVTYEATIGEVRVDIRSRRRDTGAITLYQVGISSPEREVDSAIKLIDYAPVDAWRLVVICVDPAFEQRFLRLMRQRLPVDASPANVSTGLAGQVFQSYYGGP